MGHPWKNTNLTTTGVAQSLCDPQTITMIGLIYLKRETLNSSPKTLMTPWPSKTITKYK